MSSKLESERFVKLSSTYSSTNHVSSTGTPTRTSPFGSPVRQSEFAASGTTTRPIEWRSSFGRSPNQRAISSIPPPSSTSRMPTDTSRMLKNRSRPKSVVYGHQRGTASLSATTSRYVATASSAITMPEIGWITKMLAR